MSHFIENHQVNRLWGYPNSNSKNNLKTKQRYGLTELLLDPNKQWLFVLNSTLHQVDILDTVSEKHVKTFKYQNISPKLVVHKGIDLCTEKKWIILGGANHWMIWNYETNEKVISKQFEANANIVSAKISPDKQEIWVLIQDEKIVIYKIETWEIVNEIKTRGSYNFPLVWHPNGEHFLFTEMEQGGSNIYIGNIRDRIIDWELSARSNSYIIANIKFSPDGKNVIYTDAGLHIHKFPSLEQVYSLSQYSEKFDVWESPQYPDSYLLVVPYLSEKIPKEKMLIVAGHSRQMMMLNTIQDSKEILHFLPLVKDGYSTTIEGIIQGEENGLFYFTDYLGGVYNLKLAL